MLAFLFASFLLATLGSVQQQNRGIRVITEDWRAARLDPVTGTISCVVQLQVPPTNCTWDLGTGTKGQTSASFYTNGTLFFLAQEKCENGIGRTLVLFMYGPSCYGTNKPWHRSGTAATSLVNVKTDLMDLNFAWDHTCNIVVISPNADSVTTNQVSNYDGQQRIQPSYPQQVGWRKVAGAGALDFGSYKPSWPHGEELNCGDKCLFYTLEEQIVDSSVVLPRAFIGRSYRTTQVLFNITDSVQLQSLTWNPFTFRSHKQQFLGLGICCSDSWCHPECQNKEKQIVLVSFLPGGDFTILETIGDFDPDTVKLGVEFSPAPFSKEFHLYVYHQKTIITYQLTGPNDGIVTGVSKLRQSPPVQWQNLHVWGNSGSL